MTRGVSSGVSCVCGAHPVKLIVTWLFPDLAINGKSQKGLKITMNVLLTFWVNFKTFRFQLAWFNEIRKMRVEWHGLFLTTDLLPRMGLGTVTIENPERHVRKASHCGSKHQQRSCVAISLRVRLSLRSIVRKSISAELPRRNLSCYCLLVPRTYIFLLCAHPVSDETHNQRNTTGEVATVPLWH